MKTKSLFISILLVLFTISSITVFAATKKEERNIGTFTKIDVGVAFKVYLKQGSSQSVAVEIDEEYINDVKTTVSNGTLHVTLNSNKNKGENRNIEVMNVYVTMPTITAITASAAAKVVVETPISNNGKLSLNISAAASIQDATVTCKDLSLDISGAAKCMLNVKAENVDVSVSGAAKVELTGDATYLSVDASGASKVDALNLKADKTAITKSGVASVIGYK